MADPSVLQTFTRPKKLENLISSGALKVGDQLILEDEWDYPAEEKPIHRVKSATVCRFSRALNIADMLISSYTDPHL